MRPLFMALRQVVGSLLKFLTRITEFAAISMALSAQGVSPWISVPVSVLGLTLMIVTGSQ
jgi:hypothetical protein